ncbi:MAG: hypothetical protein KC877_04495 [Candidatus Kaiserbacteria bacterium]|nr:hypothetical protein [Candidatus Kaiserbacteria bacterium]MCB9816577.1 hypothetical protein [Candidatus Nomurabacteria bacterium]
MFATIINDCRDTNARARQTSRLASLLGVNVSFVGVESDLEAGVQLIDILDATEGRPGVILVNVAPRGGHTTKWENGTPFAYFHYHDTLVLTTVDGFALSAVKSLGLATEVNLLDTHTAADAMLAAGFIDEDAASRIPITQFRSFDFTPRVAAFLFTGHEVPHTSYSLSEVPDLPPAVWHIDNFGNCKTTLTEKDLSDSTELTTRFGTLPYITQLRDVPDSKDAVITGSSGIKTHRWLELVCQRSPFATSHQVSIGDDIFEDKSYQTTATSLEND